MARATRKKIYYKKTAKWSPNIQEIGTTTITAAANSTFYQYFTLAFNPTQVNTAVSQVFTVKNVEVSFYIDQEPTNTHYLEDIAAYIMFVPQGMNITADYNIQHPEYIMAYKFLGSPSYDSTNSSQQYQPQRVKTRLMRKLQSGDNIILFVKGNNTSTNNQYQFDFHGLVRWWTKAN